MRTCVGGGGSDETLIKGLEVRADSERAQTR